MEWLCTSMMDSLDTASTRSPNQPSQNIIYDWPEKARFIDSLAVLPEMLLKMTYFCRNSIWVFFSISW